MVGIGQFGLYRKGPIHQTRIRTIYTKLIGGRPIVKNKNNINSEISFSKSSSMEIERGKEKNGEKTIQFQHNNIRVTKYTHKIPIRRAERSELE